MAAQVRGPADERRDAIAKATKSVAPAARDLMRSPVMADLELLGRRPNPLFDELVSRRRGQALTKAQTIRSRGPAVTLERVHVEGMSMADSDPTRWGRAPVYLDRPVGLGFNQLREIVRQDVQLDLIIATRIAQVLRYLKPPRGEALPGFQLGFKDRNREVTDGDSQRFQALYAYLANCGLEANPTRRRAMRRDSLRDFAQKHLRDSLTMDAAPIELVPTVGGRMHGWVAVDPATVFLTDRTFGLLGQGDEHSVPALNTLLGRAATIDPSEVMAVRNVDGQITAWYTFEDLLYPLRNPSTDERRLGYGDAEPESVLRMVTGFLNAITYNLRALDDNSVPPGVLVLHGDFEDDDLDFLKNDWLSEASGVSNRHRLPVMATKNKEEGGVSYVSTGAQVSDIAWAKFITLTTAIKCSRYLMDPTEIAFEGYHAGNTSSLNAGADTEERIASSRDKGLHGLLDWFAGSVNELIEKLDDTVELSWTGLDTSREEASKREEQLNTWGELRAKHGLTRDDMPEELLNAPLSPILTSVYQMTLQQKAMAQGQPVPSAPGAPQPDANDQDEDDDASDDQPDEAGEYTDDDGEQWRRADDTEQDDPRPVAKAATLFDPYIDPR